MGLFSNPPKKKKKGQKKTHLVVVTGQVHVSKETNRLTGATLKCGRGMG